MTVVEKAPPTVADMRSDSNLAMDLASYAHGTGPAADQLRRRLRSHISLLADPAEEYAKGLADDRARDVALGTVAYARTLLTAQITDPVAALRLLAKHTDFLLRYATAHRQGR
ncbi:DUF6415 family natural product biosynthesis protein [Streptomyces sp. 5.8]|uniref:DUF6415 family natural product biosynthesis protein n=1 Tax=Streptomyces sp. 5.8 TaxID=3406571 RepID=UPI003BB6F53A